MRRALILLLIAALTLLAAACSPADDTGAPVRVPGADPDSLTSRERRELQNYLGQLISPCPSVAVPVGQCIAEKRACRRCDEAAKFIYQSVRDGLASSQIQAEYKRRFDPSARQNVDVTGAPAKGAENARVVIVEFADFECPFCRRMSPVLDKVVADHPNDVRLYFKFYPLVDKHPHADAAARAAAAALLQGKFWEMHHTLFEHQANLEDRDIEAYAAEIGLDVPRFIQDMKSPEVRAKVDHDRQQGDDLKVEFTPYIYVNGRVFDAAHENIEEWVVGELRAAP